MWVTSSRKPVLGEAVGGLPDAVSPLALSLNENPFPPLRAVRLGGVDVEKPTTKNELMTTNEVDAGPITLINVFEVDREKLEQFLAGSGNVPS